MRFHLANVGAPACEDIQQFRFRVVIEGDLRDRSPLAWGHADRFREEGGEACCSCIPATMRYLVYAHIMVGEQSFRQLDSFRGDELGHRQSRHLLECLLELG